MCVLDCIVTERENIIERAAAMIMRLAGVEVNEMAT